MDAAHQRARISGRGGRNGACVHHSQVTVISPTDEWVARLTELPSHVFDLALVEAATDGFEEDVHARLRLKAGAR